MKNILSQLDVILTALFHDVLLYRVIFHGKNKEDFLSRYVNRLFFKHQGFFYYKARKQTSLFDVCFKGSATRSWIMLLFCKYLEGCIFPRIKRKTKRIGSRARTDIHTGRAKGWKTFIQSGSGLGFPTLKRNLVFKSYPLGFHNFTINPPWSCL